MSFGFSPSLFFDSMQIISDKIDKIQDTRLSNRRVLKEFPLKRREQIALKRRYKFIDGRKILQIDGFAKRRQHQIALDDLCEKEKALDAAIVILQDANVFSHQVSAMIDIADTKLDEIESEKTRIECIEKDLASLVSIDKIQKITRSESNFGHVFSDFVLVEKTRAEECINFIDATKAGLIALEKVQLAEEAVIIANIRLLTT